MLKRLFASLSVLVPAILLPCAPAHAQGNAPGGSTTAPLYQYLPPSQTGILFEDRITETPSFNIQDFIYAYNGGGVAVGDINGDGLPDLYFSATQLPNRLYLNKGNFTFEDISARAGVGDTAGIRFGVNMVDIDGDADLDIYVCKQDRPNALYINNGDLTFTERAREFGLDHDTSSTQSAFFDYDLDGDLDMYLLTNGTATGENYTRKGLCDHLYRNNGNNTFTDVTAEAGIFDMGYGLGVGIGDINNDGWPDIYITNDFDIRDILYINNGNGTFREETRKAMKHTAENGMGNDVADFNNDGFVDIIAVDMLPEDHKRLLGHMGSQSAYSPHFDSTQLMRNVLHLNRGNGTFADVAQIAGVSETDWSWASLFEDLDNDGYKDLFIANGYKRDVSNLDVIYNMVKTRMDKLTMLSFVPTTRLQNYVFRNNGDLTFTKMIDEWGFNQVINSNGAAFADLDRDGDLDVMVNNMDSVASIYRGTLAERHIGNYLRVQLVGKGLNTEGIGARVELRTKQGLQMRENYKTRGYLSSMEPILHFGLGDATSVEQVKVTWPDGTKQILTSVPANQVLKLEWKNAAKIDEPPAAPVATIFNEVKDTTLFPYSHRENLQFDDFEQERLLPNRLSRNGPGVAVGDINGDGREDVYVGGAKFAPGKIYLQQADGSFVHHPQQAISDDSACEDLGSLLFDADGDLDLDLYVVSGGNEYISSSPELQDRLYINDGKGSFTKSDGLPEMLSSGSCVIASDYDNDGDLDLFVGGRVSPGAYPNAPRSYILNNAKGKFTDVTETIAPSLARIGMVTSALWSDYDNDNDPDLILVGEWMTPKIVRNDKGKFADATTGSGVEGLNGWWNSLASGDFDNDGDIDYVAGNIGRNVGRRFRATKEFPLRLYANDFDDNGSLDLVMSYYYRGIEYPTRGRQKVADQMPPLIRRKFSTFAGYASASILEIYDKKKLDDAMKFQVTHLATSYIENLGRGKFKVTELPTMAQLSPTYGVNVEDYDADGNLDVLLIGNFYGPDQDVVRYDAGAGLFLRGDGKGTFTPTPVNESGFFAPSDNRGLASLQKGNSNSLYTLVLNNNGRTQVFERDFSEADGKLMNFEKEGKYTHMIMKFADGRTRRYECTIGSGYLSQCSGTVLVTPEAKSVTLYRGSKQVKTIKF